MESQDTDGNHNQELPRITNGYGNFPTRKFSQRRRQRGAASAVPNLPAGQARSPVAGNCDLGWRPPEGGPNNEVDVGDEGGLGKDSLPVIVEPVWYPFKVEPSQLLMHAQRLQALAQAGLAYTTNSYDIERYQEIRSISAKLLQELTEEPFEKIIRVFACEEGYQTPKVDIRAVVTRDDSEILLVREKGDNGRWTLPGGWADVGYTPFEVAAKEANEETGLVVEPVRLLALFDKRKHPHPPQPWYVYKAFIQCEFRSGSLVQNTAETSGACWFQREELSSIELSTDRTTASQLETVFRLACDPRSPVLCD